MNTCEILEFKLLGHQITHEHSNSKNVNIHGNDIKKETSVTL